MTPMPGRQYGRSRKYMIQVKILAHSGYDVLIYRTQLW